MVVNYMFDGGFWRRFIYFSADQEEVYEIVGSLGGRLLVRRVDGSTATTPIPSQHMPEDDLKPVRVDHVGIEMPDPSQKNLQALALKGWLDYSAQMQLILDHPMPSWNELPDEIKDVWYRVARGQHAVLTLLGGGTVEEIDAE